MKMMKAARLHAFDKPMQVDEIPVPVARSTDVVVEVRACGVVENLSRVISNYYGKHRVMPDLPAIFGLDATGVVADVGSQVYWIKPGDRVYVNPGRGCGSCKPCRAGKVVECPLFTFTGYFGRSKEIMRDYPYGGLSQYLTAPPSALAVLPPNVSFEGAARFGYIGTAYSALKKVGVGPGTAVLINGITGILGVNAAMVALAMGATKILGTGRKVDLLQRVKALAPERINTFAFDSRDLSAEDAEAEQNKFIQWAKDATESYGADCLIDCMPPGAPAATFMRSLLALRRAGRAVNVGAIMETLPLNAFWLMGNAMRLEGSVWFETFEAQEMADMAAAGTLDLSVLDHRIYPLSRVHDALDDIGRRQGGFDNYVIDPTHV